MQCKRLPVSWFSFIERLFENTVRVSGHFFIRLILFVIGKFEFIKLIVAIT